MDRDTLFMAKRSDNGEWVEGYYFCMTHTDGRHVHHFIIPLGTDLSLGTPIEKIQVEIEPETLCQYSGLTDKNKRKIFEGDIIIEVDSGNIGIIKFGLYKFKHYGFYIEWMGNCGYRQDIYHWTSYRMIRVIGNIFDNPELLKAGQQANADVLMPAT